METLWLWWVFLDHKDCDLLPAESIEKVEVVTSPSARYEASGTAGILNIILKKEELEGFNGSLCSEWWSSHHLWRKCFTELANQKSKYFQYYLLRDSESRGGGIFESENFDPLRFVNEDREYIRNRKSVFLI